MNFNTYENSNHLMTVNKCCVGLHMPPALKSIGHGEAEVTHGLPPSAPRMAFLVDEYPACPESWVRSSGRIKSYFVPVKDNHGLWLNFNDTLAYVQQDIAAVVSIQGINAVTGLPCADPALEQYIDKCPRHKVAFGPDRFCKECNFKWPKQNYLATTGTPPGLFWLDGFRAGDGVIRQYVLTAQKARGVAQCLIGAERVFALGISFFLSKTQRPEPVHEPMRGSACAASGDWSSSICDNSICDSSNSLYDSTLKNAPPTAIYCSTSANNASVDSASALFNAKKTLGDASELHDKISARRSAAKLSLVPPPIATLQVKTLEVAAGAKVDQHTYDDPNSLDFWQAEPDGIIVINYCTEEDAEKIIEAGKQDVSGSPEGYLQSLPKGN